MTEFKVNDLVSIIAQPNSSKMNSHIHMQGLSGYILEIHEGYAQFAELNEKGYGGVDGVPLSCLKLENDNKRLQEFKRIKDDKIAKLLADCNAFNEAYAKKRKIAIEQAAKEARISFEAAEAIFEASSSFEEDWEKNEGAAYDY